MLKFFENVTTLTELRKEYRRLAFIYHPDKGGDTVLMQILNDRYDRLSEKFIKENVDFSEGRKEYEMQVSEEIREMLDRLMFLQGVDIEVIGGWIWITGNTFAVRTTLKSLGFMFSHPKTAWYWHKGEYRKKNGKLQSMEDIRAFWGSQKIETQPETSNHLN